jgi:hypothetical protein
MKYPTNCGTSSSVAGTHHNKEFNSTTNPRTTLVAFTNVPEIEASRAVETIRTSKDLRRGETGFNSSIDNLATVTN